MNTISKTHQRFSEYLNNPRVLTNPEDFLGPNFEAVLNFWLILDELSQKQLRIVEECQRAFFDENYSKWSKEANLAYEASKKVVGEYYAERAGWAARVVTKSGAGVRVTKELIGMHLILDQEKPLTFFEMFLEVL